MYEFYGNFCEVAKAWIVESSAAAVTIAASFHIISTDTESFIVVNDTMKMY